MRRGEAAVAPQKGRPGAQYAGGMLLARVFVRACLLWVFAPAHVCTLPCVERVASKA